MDELIVALREAAKELEKALQEDRESQKNLKECRIRFNKAVLKLEDYLRDT